MPAALYLISSEQPAMTNYRYILTLIFQIKPHIYGKVGINVGRFSYRIFQSAIAFRAP